MPFLHSSFIFVHNRYLIAFINSFEFATHPNGASCITKSEASLLLRGESDPIGSAVQSSNTTGK